jgi:hypothetical protein
MLLDQLRSEPFFVRGLLRENETRFTVPRSTLLRTSSGPAHESVLSVQSMVTRNSRLLFLAEFLESGIGAQGIPERVEPEKGRRNGRWVVKPAAI